MKTLYDLLEALPHDDAEGLRTAFRKAVKGAHPDLRPDDPDAALKFRQIVRANEILGDIEQRATYDHLLDLARQEQESASKHAIAATIHEIASGVMALAGGAVVTVGGYLLLMHMSAASIAPANHVDVTMRAPSEIVAFAPTEAPEPDTTSKSASLEKQESASIPSEAVAPTAIAPQTHAESLLLANVGPTPDLAGSDARSLRARGIAAYHNGDLNGAIADLDHAIRLDPKYSAAYIDRGIIYYRLRQFDRAFADLTRAKRIEKRLEKAGRLKSAPATAGKPRPDQAEIAPSVTPVSERRTAEQDPSREAGNVPVRLR